MTLVLTCPTPSPALYPAESPEFCRLLESKPWSAGNLGDEMLRQELYET